MNKWVLYCRISFRICTITVVQPITVVPKMWFLAQLYHLVCPVLTQEFKLVWWAWTVPLIASLTGCYKKGECTLRRIICLKISCKDDSHGFTTLKKVFMHSNIYISSIMRAYFVVTATPSSKTQSMKWLLVAPVQKFLLEQDQTGGRQSSPAPMRPLPVLLFKSAFKSKRVLIRCCGLMSNRCYEKLLRFWL